MTTTDQTDTTTGSACAFCGRPIVEHTSYGERKNRCPVTADQSDQCSRCGRPAMPDCCLEPPSRIVSFPCTPKAHSWLAGERVCRCGESERTGSCIGWMVASRLPDAEITAIITGKPPREVTAESLTDEQIRELRLAQSTSMELRRQCSVALDEFGGRTSVGRHEARRRIAAAISARKAVR